MYTDLEQTRYDVERDTKRKAKVQDAIAAATGDVIAPHTSFRTIKWTLSEDQVRRDKALLDHVAKLGATVTIIPGGVRILLSRSFTDKRAVDLVPELVAALIAFIICVWIWYHFV